MSLPPGYNEAGAEWLEPWCDEHPDLDGQGCVACIGASHDAWMHRAKAAEAEVARLREAVAAAKAVAWCVADPYDDASDVIVERESWAQLRRALAALEAGER
jgi:hypothetical protein